MFRVLVFLVAFGFSSRHIAWSEEKLDQPNQKQFQSAVYKFKNGAELRVSEVSAKKSKSSIVLEYHNGNAKKSVVEVGDRAIGFPKTDVSESERERQVYFGKLMSWIPFYFREYPQRLNFTLVGWDDDLIYIHESGKVEIIETRRWFQMKESLRKWKPTILSDKKHTYAVYRVERLGTGDHTLFIFRDDGKELRNPILDSRGAAATSINDGRMVFTNAEHQINLAKFSFIHEESSAPGSAESQSAQHVMKLGKEVPAGDLVDTFATEMMGESEERSAFPLSNGDPFLRKFSTLRLREESSSVVVLGTPGSGKSEFIESYVARVKRGEDPHVSKTTRFMWVSASSLVAGTEFTGAFESNIQAIIALSKNGNIVWVFDEAHALRGAGTHQSNSNDAFQMLKPHMASGLVRWIGTSTQEEWSQAVSGDSALMRRVQTVTLEEPSEEELIGRIQNWCARYSLPTPKRDFIERLIQISNEYDGVGAQPAKATRLLSMLFAVRKMNKKEKSNIFTLEDLHEAAELSYSGVQIPDAAKVKRSILSKLRTDLDESIVGNLEIKDAIVEMELLNQARVRSRKGAAISMFLVGQRGLAKTSIPQVYADSMKLPFLRIELNRHEAWKAKDEILEMIASALEKNPQTVILIDEVEKADPEIQNVLLRMLDEGRISIRRYLNSGREASKFITLDTSRCRLFFATNAGEDFLKKLSSPIGFDSGRSHSIQKDRLKEAVALEGVSRYLIDRVPDVFAVQVPTQEDFKKILKTHLNKFVKELQKGRKYSILVEEGVSDFLVSRLTKEFFDSRTRVSPRDAIAEMKRVLGLQVATAELLSQPGGSLSIRCGDLLKVMRPVH